MQRHLLLMYSIGKERDEFTKYSKILCEMYAKKHDIDFIFLNSFNNEKKYKDIRFLKLDIIYYYLHKYERVMYLDDTCLINPSCENLFNIVNEKKIGAMIESNYFNRKQYFKRLVKILLKEDINVSDWIMINNGVLVVSKHHKNLFYIHEHYKNIINEKNDSLDFKDQSFTTIKLNTIKPKYEIFDLTLKYNLVGSKILKLYNNNEIKKCMDYKICHITRGTKDKRTKIIKEIYKHYSDNIQ